MVIMKMMTSAPIPRGTAPTMMTMAIFTTSYHKTNLYIWEVAWQLESVLQNNRCHTMMQTDSSSTGRGVLD